jgi:hypothetical protein
MPHLPHPLRNHKAKKAKQKRLANELATNAKAVPPVVAGNGGKVTATGNDESANALAPNAGHDAKAERQMREELQKALTRPVILVREPWQGRVLHKAIEHRRAIGTTVVVGLGIASVATAGTVAAGLAIGVAVVPALDFPTFFDNKMHAYNSAVILEQAAITALLVDIKDDPEERARIVQAAISTKDNPDSRVTLTGDDITTAMSAARQLTPDTGTVPLGAVRVGVRLGIAVAGSGLLLLALTVIPEDIHTLMIRVASVILVVGVLIVGFALANSSALKGRLPANT